MAEQPAMTSGNVWIHRAKFVGGVLAVWGFVLLVGNVWSEISSMNGRFSSRLREGQLCVVDTHSDGESVWGPVPCAVYDLDFQRDRVKNFDTRRIAQATVDVGTLVLIDSDFNPPALLKKETGNLDIDNRAIEVYFLSGPLSGSLGHLPWYRLEPVKP